MLLYLIDLADHCGIDLPQAAQQKITKNGIKYPALLARGSCKKYTAYSNIVTTTPNINNNNNATTTNNDNVTIRDNNTINNNNKKEENELKVEEKQDDDKTQLNLTEEVLREIEGEGEGEGEGKWVGDQ